MSGIGGLMNSIIDGEYVKFSSYPPEHQTPESASVWFDVKMALLDDPEQETVEAYYDEIPEALRSQKLNLRLIKSSPFSLARFSPTPMTEREYCQLVCEAAIQDSKSLNLVAPEYQTERTVMMVLSKAPHTIHRLLKNCGWVKRELTPALIDLSAQTGVSVLLAVDESQISNKALDYLLTNHLDSHYQVRKAGKLHLLSKGIELGYWPRAKFSGPISKPTCLPAGVRMLLCATSENTEALYLAYVKNFPVGKVVRLLKGPIGRKFLLEAYTTDELSPHIKQMDSSLKGQVLGRAMGL